MRRLTHTLLSALIGLLLLGLIVPIHPWLLMAWLGQATGWPIARWIDRATLLGFLAIAVAGFVISRKPLRR